MRYKKSEIISMIQTCKPERIYNHKAVNFKSKTIDTKEFVTEVIASVCDVKLFEKINIIRRESYRVESHYKNGEICTNKTDTNRLEENEAIELIDNTDKLTICNSNASLGEMLDYQIPLKGKQSDKAGKIDLISVNHANKILYIIEMKNSISKESLLRCIMEIETYYRQLDKTIFRDS